MEYSYILVLILLSAFPIARADSVLACPIPNEACNCDLGSVVCRGITYFPQNLPENVTFLDLDSNPIGSALSRNQVQRLGHISLFQLYLSGTGLRAIQNKAFQSQPSLRTLDLSNNVLERLQSHIFIGLDELENLFLINSAIYEISAEVFMHTPKLRYLNLGGNKLSKVTMEFMPLANLKNLILSNNEISSISSDAFVGLSQLNHLDITGNHLTVPKAELFIHIVSNNGTIEQQQSNLKNQWDCRGLQALEYHDFLRSLNENDSMKNRCDIKCYSPPQFSGLMLSELDRTDLVNSLGELFIDKSQPTIREEVKAPSAESTVLYADTKTDTATTTTMTQKVARFSAEMGDKSANSLSRLSDAQIALIFASVITVAIIITAFVVRQCVVEKRKRAFGEFIDKLPSTMEVDEDDTLTTKTYRHDAPVYGSTGNVIDRHKRTLDHALFGATNIHYGLPAIENNSPSKPPGQKRKPPPYEPPPTSPDGFESAYEKPQFNNNSSATPVDDYYGYRKMLRRIASDPVDYDSDDGNVLWNVKNVKSSFSK